MLIFFKVIGIQLAWFGCLTVYLSSDKQPFLVKAISKKIAWPVFALFSTLAVVLLEPVYNLPTAIFFALIVIMLSWVVLALWSPHSKNIKIVVPVITFVMLLGGLFGGGHVG